MSFYLLDHGQNVKWTPGNFLKVAVVMHCTAGLDIADEVRRAGGEWAGVDNSAERTYEWCANTTTESSWQSGSDWDSIVDGLPSGYVAWHVRGYNTYTIGHEISKTDMTWADEHEMWVGPTLLNAAIKVRQHCDKHGIPIRRIDKAQLDRAIAAKDPSMGGLTEHQLLDPERRRDPGDDFPWGRFIGLVKNPTGDDMPLTPEDLEAISRVVANVPIRHRDPVHGGPGEHLPLHKALSIATVNATVGRRVAQSLLGDVAGLRSIVRDALADSGLDNDALAEKIVQALAAELVD